MTGAIMTINSGVSFSTTCSKTDQKYDIQTILVHELGHVIGFDNVSGTCTKENTAMYEAVSKSDCRRSIKTIDINAVNKLYPDNTAAGILGFSVVNSVASWFVETSYHTDTFLLEGRNLPADSWDPIPITIPVRLGKNTVSVAGSGFRYYRLVEVEKSGHRLVHGVTMSEIVNLSALPGSPSGNAERDRLTMETLKNQIETLKKKAQAAGGLHGIPRASAANATLVIYTNNVMQAAVTTCIADFWEAAGYQVSVELVDGYPSGPNEFRSTLDGAILNEYQNGATYFLLVGDANDYMEFSQPWPGEWETIRQDYLTTGYPTGGQPEKDIIPTFIIEDPRPRKRGMSWYAPYWFTDQPYADVDGDEIPDVVVSRLPFTTEADVYAYATKLWNDSSWNADTAALLVGNRNSGYGYNDGTRARLAAWDVMQYVPQWVSADTLYWTDCYYQSDRNTLPAQLINAEQPELVVSLASLSNRNYPGDFFDKTISYEPWDMGMLTTTQPHVFIAASCGSADYVRSENSTYGLPIVHEFLAEPYKGAVSWIGPTAGTWQAANEVIASYIVEELYRIPGRPGGEAFRVAIERVLAEYAGDQQIVNTARSYVYLGDPLVPFRGIPAVDISTFFRYQAGGSFFSMPEYAAIGCPFGDGHNIVVYADIAENDVEPPLTTDAITISQPVAENIVFFGSLEADSIEILPNGDYRAHIIIDEFSGCNMLDSAVVSLHDCGLGYAYLNVRSPDLASGDPKGTVDINDLSIFGANYTSPPKPYYHCVDYNWDEHVDIIDFSIFGQHYLHSYDPGSASSRYDGNVVFSSGNVDLQFSENYPLQGKRTLQGSVTLVNVEAYKVMLLSFKNENPHLVFSNWVENPDYPGITMCTEVIRNGQKEIVLGIVGSKNTVGFSTNLGYFELEVNSSAPLDLTDDDFALVTADILESNGGTLVFKGSQMTRTLEPTTYRNQLAQNFPNPFNPSTTIAFSIAEETDVELSIYDVRGALIRTLVNEHRKTNNYKEIWDGRDNKGQSTASGVYFYRLTAGAYTATKKMVLLR
jgi:hypothetical protein